MRRYHNCFCFYLLDEILIVDSVVVGGCVIVQFLGRRRSRRRGVADEGSPTQGRRRRVADAKSPTEGRRRRAADEGSPTRSRRREDETWEECVPAAWALLLPSADFLAPSLYFRLASDFSLSVIPGHPIPCAFTAPTLLHFLLHPFVGTPTSWAWNCVYPFLPKKCWNE